jgi:hypothetical protein
MYDCVTPYDIEGKAQRAPMYAIPMTEPSRSFPVKRCFRSTSCANGAVPVPRFREFSGLRAKFERSLLEFVVWYGD